MRDRVVQGRHENQIDGCENRHRRGCAMVITEGSRPNPLSAIDQGVPSTWFTAVMIRSGTERVDFIMKPMGRIVVMQGPKPR